MLAFQVHSHNHPPRLTELPNPSPGPGQLCIRVHATALNHSDLLLAAGSYQDTPPVPFTLGMEVSGVVVDVGPDVDEAWIGKRVSAFCGSGGLAEYLVVGQDRAVEMPKPVSFEDAAAFQVAYGTSHLALAHRARLSPGERLLVLGAAGGVGLTAIEIGKLLGAEVIAVARGPEKLAAAAKAGADHLIDSTDTDIRIAVKALGGADVVYDPVGGDSFTAALRACNPEARILTIGFASGEVPPIAANHLLVKNIDVIGFYWGGYLKFNPSALTESLGVLLGWLQSGKITPHISHVLPLEQVEDGITLLRERSKATGKILITPAIDAAEPSS